MSTTKADIYAAEAQVSARTATGALMKVTPTAMLAIADQYLRYKAENKRLREALDNIAVTASLCHGFRKAVYEDSLASVARYARAALKADA